MLADQGFRFVGRLDAGDYVALHVGTFVIGTEAQRQLQQFVSAFDVLRIHYQGNAHVDFGEIREFDFGGNGLFRQR